MCLYILTLFPLHDSKSYSIVRFKKVLLIVRGPKWCGQNRAIWQLQVVEKIPVLLSMVQKSGLLPVEIGSLSDIYINGYFCYIPNCCLGFHLFNPQADLPMLLELMASLSMLFVRSSHSLDNNQVEDGTYAQLAATDNSNKRIPFCFKIPAVW